MATTKFVAALAVLSLLISAFPVAFFVANAAAEVTATNFNTHSGNDYQGISVGFTLDSSVGNVTVVTVELFKGVDLIVANTHNQALLDLINNDGETSLSTPFIITPGTYTETYWNLGSHTWTTDDKPTRAVITVTDENGTHTAENTNLVEPNDWIFESLVPSAPVVPPTNESETIVVRQDTGSFNEAGAWMFDRDQDTSTPFEFNTDERVIGNGALYVAPIGDNPSDKFIAEYFAKVNMGDLESFSFDFKMGAGVDVALANHFYMNVYVNRAGTDVNNWYECKYDVVATTGSTSGFTTVTFDPTQAYPVTGANCPDVPADLGPDATIRSFAINVGDTSVNDEGLEGYLDNVVMVTRDTANNVVRTTTFDLEPETPSTSGGGGGGGYIPGQRPGSSTPDGEVLGDSIDLEELEDALQDALESISGDQVTVVPTGAPNTGAGGMNYYVVALALALAAFATRRFTTN